MFWKPQYIYARSPHACKAPPAAYLVPYVEGVWGTHPSPAGGLGETPKAVGYFPARPSPTGKLSTPNLGKERILFHNPTLPQIE
jgi:hypothetical protein